MNDVTAREVAAHFGVKPRTVLAWHADGKIPAAAVTRLGGTPRGRLRFRIDKIEAAWGYGPGAGGEVSPTPTARPARGVVYEASPTPIRGGQDEAHSRG